MRLSVAEIAAQLGLDPPSVNPEVTGAAIDSRKVATGDIFICLPGTKTDGHDYAAAAVRSGAVAVLAARPLPEIGAPVLVVEDPELALGRLAQFWRSGFGGKVAVITGTCGKTTCKEALAAILRKAGKTAATMGNLNNQLGLPLTILNTDGDEDFWVLEAGISKPGDMEYLAGIARPDLGLIINAGKGHEEGLGVRGVAWHKAQLLRFLAPEGIGLVNSDYPELAREARATGAGISFFSPANAACMAADSSEYRYSLDLDGERIEISAPMTGRAGRENALAAALAAKRLGANTRQIRSGFQDMQMAPGRGQISQIGRLTLIDATYNANPLSMACMLEQASGLARKSARPLLLVLGAMLELGESAASEHARLGLNIASARPHLVFWKGDWLDDLAAGLERGASERSLVLSGEDAAKTASAIFEDPLTRQNGAVILFQGSRANRLEEHMEALRQLMSQGGADVL